MCNLRALVNFWGCYGKCEINVGIKNTEKLFGQVLNAKLKLKAINLCTCQSSSTQKFHTIVV